MGMKLRINVVSPSRDKRFLVLAEREWTIDILQRCTENVFHRLYPREPKMNISAIQNEFHSDIPFDYHVEDVLTDAGLIFVVEEEANSNPLPRYSYMTASSVKKSSDEEDRHSIPRKRKSKKKRWKSNQLEQVDETSSDRVTSTTSPVLVEEGKGSNLTPQLVEKICEDPEVDIETIEDESEQKILKSCEGTELPTGTDDTESRIEK